MIDDGDPVTKASTLPGFNVIVVPGSLAPLNIVDGGLLFPTRL